MVAPPEKPAQNLGFRTEIYDIIGISGQNRRGCEPPKAPLDQSSRIPILHMLYDLGIVTGPGLSKDNDFENVGRPAAEASADLGSPSDRRAIAATCSKVPTVIRSRPHKPRPAGFDLFYAA